MNATVVFDWDLSAPKKLLMSRNGFDADYVDAMETEYKRFQAIRVLHPTEIFPISEPVDELWHAHILFSRDYQKMAAMAGHPLHHEPIVSMEDRLRLAPQYLETVKRYREHFGEPSAVFWPANQERCGSCGSGIDDAS